MYFDPFKFEINYSGVIVLPMNGPGTGELPWSTSLNPKISMIVSSIEKALVFHRYMHQDLELKLGYSFIHLPDGKSAFDSDNDTLFKKIIKHCNIELGGCFYLSEDKRPD